MGEIEETSTEGEKVNSGHVCQQRGRANPQSAPGTGTKRTQARNARRKRKRDRERQERAQ